MNVENTERCCVYKNQSKLLKIVTNLNRNLYRLDFMILNYGRSAATGGRIDCNGIFTEFKLYSVYAHTNIRRKISFIWTKMCLP